MTMKPEEITNTLKELFSAASVETHSPGLWQVEAPGMRLLVLLSDDQSWLRTLVPIAPYEEAQPFVEQVLEANFDTTQETRYALHQGLLWVVFQHSRESLTQEDFRTAIARLVSLHQVGLSNFFKQLVEARITQIIRVAKQQGQSLQATLQTLERFYEEGLMGEMERGAESREAALEAWRRQLERLWPEVDFNT